MDHFALLDETDHEPDYGPYWLSDRHHPSERDCQCRCPCHDPYDEYGYARDATPMRKLASYNEYESLLSNVQRLAVPIFGDGVREWATDLARRLIEQVPEAAAGRPKRAWVGAVLWAAAEREAAPDAPFSWRGVHHDVLTAVGTGVDGVRRRFRQMAALGLTEPAS